MERSPPGSILPILVVENREQFYKRRRVLLRKKNSSATPTKSDTACPDILRRIPLTIIVLAG